MVDYGAIYKIAIFRFDEEWAKKDLKRQMCSFSK